MNLYNYYELVEYGLKKGSFEALDNNQPMGLFIDSSKAIISRKCLNSSKIVRKGWLLRL